MGCVKNTASKMKNKNKIRNVQSLEMVYDSNNDSLKDNKIEL